MKKRNTIIYIAVFAVILIASFSLTWYWLSLPREEVYSVQNGVLSYTNRPQIEFSSEVWREDNDSVVYRVWFTSHSNATVYGLLGIPKKEGPLPAFFILPAATVTKEGEYRSLGENLVEMGYIVLALDQRGHGETGGIILRFEDDYQFYRQGYEPIQHQMVYDGLRAFDLLYSLPGTDKSRIYAAGESMGGNYAMVAAGIEPRIQGLMLVSSAGYRFPPQSDPGFAGFLTSISGITYIDDLSPRPLLMLHDEGDTVVDLDDARFTYSLAGEPKTLLTIDFGSHSYTSKMRGILEQGLQGW